MRLATQPRLQTPPEVPAVNGRAALRIAHVVLSLDCGGLERVVVALAREGKQRGQRLTVICLERPGALAPQIEALGITVVCLHKKRGIRWSLVRQLKGRLADLRPDVVHTHQIGALFYAGPAAKRARVPVVVHTEHGKHYAARLRTRWLGRWAGRYVDRFFCVSKDIAEEVGRHWIVPKTKIDVVANGIDMAPFESDCDPRALRCSLGIPDEAPLVGTVGRLNEIKRQDLLIRAVARMPRVHLLLVGDGPRMGSLRELADALGISDRVHFAGYQAEPELYYRTMNVFALTSRSEGMPLSVLEAWAAGLPVVASDVGGLPDLVEEGQTGLLFPSGNDQVLTDRLRSLVDNRDWARQLGEAGREKVRQRFDTTRMASDYERHYAELLRRNGE